MSRRLTLKPAFFQRPTVEVARALLGCHLVHDTPEGRCVGRIVETEAYLAEADPASHSASGETDRNRAMFGHPGSAYVYLIYGVHHCLNVVTARQGIGEAVLLRALEPLEGLDSMSERRGTSAPKNLCSGPGKLVQAMGVDRSHDGVDLRRGALGLWTQESFGEDDGNHLAIVAGPRIGVRSGVELPLRFCLKGSPWLSR